MHPRSGQITARIGREDERLLGEQRSVAGGSDKHHVMASSGESAGGLDEWRDVSDVADCGDDNS